MIIDLNTAMEKCYRDIQNRGQIAGLNILEIFILLGVPLLLFPIFTLIGINVVFIFLIEIVLYFLFRLASRISTFDFGLVSYIFSHLIWPRHLSAFTLDERRYLKDAQDPMAPDKKA